MHSRTRWVWSALVVVALVGGTASVASALPQDDPTATPTATAGTQAPTDTAVPTDSPTSTPSSTPTPTSTPTTAAASPTAVTYVVLPHPDDEFETLALEQQNPQQYKVFITLTNGEDTLNCTPSLYAMATLGLPAHGLPNPAPEGQGTPSCAAARLSSWVDFFQELSRTDTSLPGDFGEPTTVGPFPANGVALSHTLATGQTVTDASAKVWVDREHRGALVAFDLGDRGITPAKAAWAIRTVMANRAALGLDTALPNYAVVGAYSNADDTDCAIYTHPDHLAMAQAIRTTDFGVVVQATATCGTSPDAVETTAVSTDEMNAVYNQQTRRGAFWDAYDWLDTPTFDTTMQQNSMFMQKQSFDLHFSHVRSVRVQGADRYATSVAISQHEYPNGAPVVYVASGTSYPDALSASAAAAHRGGPLLLVPPSGATTAIDDEIRRLGASRVIVVGGPAVVPDAVLSQLQAIVPNTVRVAGADRYATSQAVLRDAFGDGPVPVVYAATGSGYADALSATSAAAAQGGAVLLVPGSASGDTGTVAALGAVGAVGAQRVVVVGGTAAVSGAFQSSLATAVPTTRISGADRYATSVAVDESVFPHASSAFIASGTNYPDALSGAAWAGSAKEPLYLSQPGCVPTPVVGSMLRTGVSSVTLLGGSASLGSGVASMATCQ
jgi:putative cell wall-binding protein